MELLTVGQKHAILREMPELEMHKKLKTLFEKMFPQKQVYIGQGVNEFGKDLVLIGSDPLSGEHVTAIVVKMGNLSGSADSGIIGTINTQILQAFNVGTYFKEIGREVKANSVIVAIFGQISNNLEKTLNGYLGQYPNLDIKVKKIDDLTLLFDQYYSKVFYISSETEELRNKYDELDKILLEKNPFLNRCYIEPNLKTYDQTKSELIVAQSTGEMSDDALQHAMFGKQETIHSLLKKIDSGKKNILVEGEAGTGKSIFSMKMIQYSIAKALKTLETHKDSSLQKLYVPVLLKANKLKQIDQTTFTTLVRTFYGVNSTNLEISYIIIDGLDEVCKEDRNNIQYVAETYCNENIKSLIFTTRKDQDTVTQLQGYARYELLPLELSQAIEFIKKMADKNQELINALLKNFGELQHQLPMTPLSLVLLVEIVMKHNEIPASITELYNKYVNMVIGADSSATDINQLFEPRYKLDFLITLSYELFYKEDNSTVSKIAFMEYVEKYVAKHSHISSVGDFLEDLKRISILNINHESVMFTHKSFLDYFIAKYYETNTEEMIRNNEFDELYTLYYTSLWQDVTYFYFGIKDRITKQQLDFLISKNPYADDKLMSNLELYALGKLLQYAWNTSKDDKKYGVNQASKNVLELRECLHEFHKKSFGIQLPKIVADATLMKLTDINYSSCFLQQEISEIIYESFQKLEKESDSSNEKVLNTIYFLSMYVLVNSNRLSNEQVNYFISNLNHNASKLNEKIFFPITVLYSLFIKHGRVEISKKESVEVDKNFKTLKRKYKYLFNDTLLFKSKIEARKFRNIGKQ